jgi:hypothetical protein
MSNPNPSLQTRSSTSRTSLTRSRSLCGSLAEAVYDSNPLYDRARILRAVTSAVLELFENAADVCESLCVIADGVEFQRLLGQDEGVFPLALQNHLLRYHLALKVGEGDGATGLADVRAQTNKRLSSDNEVGQGAG